MEVRTRFTNKKKCEGSELRRYALKEEDFHTKKIIFRDNIFNIFCVCFFRGKKHERFQIHFPSNK